MHLELVTAPAAEPVTFEEVVNHLRVNDIERAHEALIKAARQHIDGRDGWLGRALITQTWDMKLDAFPENIKVPLPPLQSVTSITYIDTNGVSQTVDADDYTIVQSEPAYITTAYGVCWPSTRCVPGAVTVRFVAGYGDGPEDVPLTIKQAMLLLIGHWYEHREVVMTGPGVSVLPVACDALLTPYRVFPWG